jgi:indolepyruvate ferredoxin oxidoreductase beta subunit
MSERPITILVCALGGEGGGVLAEWLVEAAVQSDYPVQSTSIPGVAQRTGATTYYLEIFPRREAELGGRRPVFSLNPVPGAIDLLVSSELLETVRQIGAGMATAERTQIISSRSRALTTAEKMELADGRADTDALLQVVRRHSREAQVLDMAEMAQRAGTVISAVLFGAIAASGALPFGREGCEQVIGASGRSAEASRRGFGAAFDAVQRLRQERAAVAGAVDAVAAMLAGRPDPSAAAGAAADTAPAATTAALREFPEPTREMVELGHARVLEYQDAAYATLYLERLRRVLAAERAGDPAEANGFATTREAARHLALWMAFDDIVRVADLKCRASRIERVRAEVHADDGELLRIFDHFKPGVPELAALLPTRLANAVTRWDRRRIGAGKSALALPLKIGTHTVFGFLALRTLAGLKGLRRRGSRFEAEQTMIERWLAAVERGAREDAALGRELAECGRLIKGYGATYERGKHNLLHVIDHLAVAANFDSAAQRTDAIHAARTAALTDDAGKALDAALQRHGAPPRPVPEQPMLWVRRRPGGPAGAAPKHHAAA